MHVVQQYMYVFPNHVSQRVRPFVPRIMHIYISARVCCAYCTYCRKVETNNILAEKLCYLIGVSFVSKRELRIY